MYMYIHFTLSPSSHPSPPLHHHPHHPPTPHRSTDQLMLTKVFSSQRKVLAQCSLTDFSESCPLPGEMSSTVVERSMKPIPKTHSLFNTLHSRISPPGVCGEGGGCVWCGGRVCVVRVEGVCVTVCVSAPLEVPFPMKSCFSEIQMFQILGGNHGL